MRAEAQLLRIAAVAVALALPAVIVAGMLTEDATYPELESDPEPSGIRGPAEAHPPDPSTPAAIDRGTPLSGPALAPDSRSEPPAPGPRRNVPVDGPTYITGSVADTRGNPIPGARVRLMHRVRVPEHLAEALALLNPDETDVRLLGRAVHIRGRRNVFLSLGDSGRYRFGRASEWVPARAALLRGIPSGRREDTGPDVLDCYADSSGAFRLGPIHDGVTELEGREDKNGALLVAASARGFVTRQMRFREMPLRFVLEPSGSIRGQVTTSAGRALSRCRVTLQGDGDEVHLPIRAGGRRISLAGRSRSTTTDRSGLYRLDGLSPGRYRIGLLVGAARSVTVLPGREVMCNLALPVAPDTVHATGQVVDALDHRPLAGARVLAYLERRRVVRETDPEGRFDLGPVQRTSGFRVLAPDHVEAVVRLDEPGDGLPWIFKRIALKRPPSIRGTVVDPFGRPVAGARVYGCTIATTGPFGRFHLTDLPPVESTRLIAEATGFARGISDPIELESGKVIDGVVIRLGRGAWVGGRVVDPDGRPRAGLAVELEPVSAPRLGAKTANTDRSGWFELRVPAGRYRLTVKAKFRRARVLESERLELVDGKRHFLKNLVVGSR